MKRKLLVAALLLLTALLLGGVALAASDPITCSMEVSPSSLSEPGDVTVTITISNSGDTDMKDPLTLYSPTSEIVTDFGDKGSVTLKAGEVKTWTGKWTVNQRTLDNGQIVYFIKYFIYSDNGERVAQSQPIRGKLNATESKTDIEIKRTISPGTAREGQAVTVKYDIVNTGTVSLKNVTITENKDIAKKAISVTDELKAGETAQVKFPVTMGKKDLTSSATVTYTTGDSKEKQTKTVAEQKITFGDVAMSAKLTSSAKGVAINGTITLTLELKNSGKVDYTDLRVTDKTLGDVFTNQELAAGATLKLDKEITLTATTEYQFHITAIDNTGTEVSLDTDSITLTAVDPNKVVHLNVTVGSDRTEVYTQPGIVRFTVSVENDSEVDATDVAIYHGSTLIYTFPSIPAGQTRKLTRDAALSMAGKYMFTAVTVDATGSSNKFSSNEIQIAFSIPTPAPATPTPPLVPTPEPTYMAITVPPISDPSIGTIPKLIRTFFYPLMLLGIILLLGAAVLLVLATKKRMEQKRASDTALDHLDRAKRRDYVAPSDESEEPEAPVKAEPKPVLKTSAASGRPKSESTDAEAIAEDVELPHMKYVRNAYQRNSKQQTNDYSKKSIYDEDPLTGGASFPSGASEGDEPYHTYGSDRDFYDMPPAATKGADSSARKAKDWSAYARRPEPTADGSAEPIADDAAYPDYTEDQTAYSDYTGYDDGTGVDGAAGYQDHDGYVSDPLGYGDPTPYADSQEAQDDSATYYDGQATTENYTQDYAADGYTADSGEQSTIKPSTDGSRRYRRGESDHQKGY